MIDFERKLRYLIPLISFFVVVLSPSLQAQQALVKLSPKLVDLRSAAPESLQILNGPPETVSMRSGYMVLAPTKSVGKHNTKHYEEALVVLAGEGELRIGGGPIFKLHQYTVAYCPPQTEHDVTNTGTDTLRYVYIVAKADVK